MSLDRRYGSLVDPGRPRPGESHLGPQSLSRLDGHGADLLRRIIETAPHPCCLGEVLFDAVPILWVVDANGTFLFALEDVVEVATSRYLYPRPRKLRLATTETKLGHPALVGGASARIGGELCISVDRGGETCWVLTNRSGRYGMNCGRRKVQLSNVGDDLRNAGISVQCSFLSS